MSVTLQTAALILIGCSLLACSGGSPTQPDSPGGQSQARTLEGAAFQVSPGERFSVVLPSAGAGGYQWHLAEGHDQSVARLQGTRVGALPPDVMPGRFADEIFDFVAAASGRTTLTFVQYREWEGPEKAVGTRTHVVTVR
ncbi:MAG: protease inhibitor I42 family protein [Candidatus Sericytochromatia bacterium]